MVVVLVASSSSSSGSSGSSRGAASVAELLESGQLGPWVPHLAAAAGVPYNHSSSADVALAAGQLAVLPNGTLAVSKRAGSGLAGLAWPVLAAIPTVLGQHAACRQCTVPRLPPTEAKTACFASAVQWALPRELFAPSMQQEMEGRRAFGSYWSPAFALGGQHW